MLSQNAYLKIARLKRKRQSSWLTELGGWGFVTILAIVLRGPLWEYLQTGDVGFRIEQVVFRCAALLVALGAMSTYTDIVRNPERSIFSIHPVQTTALLSVLCLERLRFASQWWWFSILLWSALPENWLLWVQIYLTSAWVGGIGSGYAVHLASVWAAKSPMLAPTLDALRGQNPREQAAFIYAPGVALGIMGLALVLGAGAVRAMGNQQIQFAWMIALPAIFGGIGWVVALFLAPKTFVRAGMLVSDIDAHWNLVDAEEEGASVYLGWTSENAPHRLRLLRQSWRLHRWVTFLVWVVGLFSALLSWVGDVWLARLSLSALSLAFLQFPVLLQRNEPLGLQRALGISEKVQQRALWEVSVLIVAGLWVLPLLFGIVRGNIDLLIWLGCLGMFGFALWQQARWVQQVQKSGLDWIGWGVRWVLSSVCWLIWILH